MPVEALTRDDARHRQVEGFVDPADRVGVVDLAVGELRWTKAVDRTADELLGADEERETERDNDGNLATQSIDAVVVEVKLEFANAPHRLEKTLHRHGL